MIHQNPETGLIRQQDLYIRTLEEQLAVCEERNKAQELLIEQLNQMPDLFAGEISRKEWLEIYIFPERHTAETGG